LNIYVGNLSYETTDQDLQAAFTAYGSVTSARIATDRDTGRSRGFGFVEMPSAQEAQAAISGLDGTQLQGRTLTVNESKPRGDRSSSGNRGYAGGGGRSRW
jgi:RNA recognition motif-containing protein